MTSKCLVKKKSKQSFVILFVLTDIYFVSQWLVTLKRKHDRFQTPLHTKKCTDKKLTDTCENNGPIKTSPVTIKMITNKNYIIELSKNQAHHRAVLYHVTFKC